MDDELILFGHRIANFEGKNLDKNWFYIPPCPTWMMVNRPPLIGYTVHNIS